MNNNADVEEFERKSSSTQKIIKIRLILKNFKKNK